MHDPFREELLLIERQHDRVHDHIIIEIGAERSRKPQIIHLKGRRPVRKNPGASFVCVAGPVDHDIDPKVVDGLLAHFPDFRRAYSEDGLSVAEFDDFAPTRRTLRQFCAACGDLNAFVRDVLIPDPDRGSS